MPPPRLTLTALTALLAVTSLGGLAYFFDSPRGGYVRSDPDHTTARPDDWKARWDPHVGLWWQDHHGHTVPVMDEARVHSAPAAAARLLLAAQARQLPQVDVIAVLGAIRKMQVLDQSADRGCLKWYWEESRPVDKNASFFTGLNLIALQRCYSGQLDETQRHALGEILKDLRPWFVARVAERDFYYPNRFLGELVCAWLIGELTDIRTDDEMLRATMLDAADYWSEHSWGWGEHLSDIYSGLCLDELSALLLFSRRLPEDVRGRYKSLFEELLSIEDAFAGRPKIPAIRSYAFDQSPTRMHYRDWVRPLSSDALALPPRSTPVMPPEAGEVFQQRPPLAATFYEVGWHRMATPPAPAQAEIALKCFNDALAAAHYEKDIAVGSLSRFPLLPTAEHFEWGMAWQSFPVGIWRPEGDWGFLQWESREGERTRAHPAKDCWASYHDNALSKSISPPTLGETYAIQRGGNVLILRFVRVIPASWDLFRDHLRLVNSHASVTVAPGKDDWRQLLLKYPERTLAIQCVPISEGARFELDEPADGNERQTVDWGISFERDALKEMRTLLVIWGISLDGAIDQAPQIRVIETSDGAPRSGEERPMELNWVWPHTRWNVRIDPLSDQPLLDLAAKH